MKYHVLLPTFHTFEIADGIIGLSFVDDAEARNFQSALTNAFGNAITIVKQQQQINPLSK